jgi:hypothetical protein
MNSGETPFIEGYPELVMAEILLPMKRAVCQKPDEALIAAS